MAEGKKKGGLGLLGYGCLGCLGAVVLVVIIGGVIGGLAIQKARTGLKDEVLTQALPTTGSAAEGLSPDAIAGDMPESAGLLRGATPGRVILNLSGADFHIYPGKPGEPTRVEASFNPGGYELVELYEPDDDGTWTYTVKFRPKGGSFLTKLGELLTGSSPRVTVYLPVDPFYDLDLDISRGGAEVNLGGLWLASADLSFSMGGCALRISEPLQAPVDTMTINASMGGGAFRDLGNASPRNLSVDFSMGGMDLGLEGEWTRDATISLSHTMGGGVVRLPDGVNIEGLGAAGKDRSGEDGPLLTFKVRSDMGELDFLN